jgi:hypothetical protein
LLLLLIVMLAAVGTLLAQALPSRPARAQTGAPPPNTLTLTMSGPSTATSGQNVTYHLQYVFSGQAFDTGIRMAIPCHTTLLSERLTNGVATIEARQGNEISWFGFSQHMSGTFEINLRIDANFAGVLRVSGYVPPGFGGEGQSNVVETQVTGPGGDTPCPPVHQPAPGPIDPACGAPRDPGEVAITGHVLTDHGTVTLPEFNLTAPITSTGCFQFRHLQLPHSPMLVSVDVESEGYGPLMWANYIILYAGHDGPIFSPPLRPGSLPNVLDPCPNLIAHPQTQSAVEQLHASLCAQLLDAQGGAGLPGTGTGTSAGDGRLPLAEIALLLICVSSLGACTLLIARSRRG